MLRRFNIVAISTRIVINSFGEHDPDGMLYILKENEEKLKEEVKISPFSTVELVQPLVIRANVGDKIEIIFENKLPFSSSMHIQGAEYNVQTSDGCFVGHNEDSICLPNGTLNYSWEVTEEGIHIFTDLGNPLSTEVGSNVHGLFGALIVEPRGSTWTDPVTGDPLKSGVFADIHNPFLPSFREYAWFFHDEMKVKDLIGQTPIDPMTMQPEVTHAVNYRAEPMRNRVRLTMEGIVCPNCEGEEVHHDSWVFGDPATPILRSYVGDPLKIRLIHAGTKETHVFHYHVHQWLSDSKSLDSEIIDSQSISPQNYYTVTPLYGAGSLQGAIGDIVIHCHLYPHFGMGMWGMQRIFDTLQDGSQCYPNGTRIHALQPLPDRPLPPEPTLERPGFPNFIPGIVGSKAPRPPLAKENGREPTILEKNQFAPNARPGAVFVNPVVEGKTPVREYHIVGIQMPIVYNKEGWHDPEGRLFVLAEDEADILAGRKPPEPLVIRANAGECVRITYTNKFPETVGGNEFQLLTRTYESGNHIHFVKFDPLVSDGANTGWNYDSSALLGETVHYQWYADTEFGATFFHDHLFATTHQSRGVFACIVIEPKGSKYLNPYTGAEVFAGTQSMIVNPLIPNFREFTLFVHDFALLFDKEGNPLNKPPFSNSQDDPGVMGINYRNEPLQFRLKNGSDPAYVFSSHLHGDPVTPLLETYNGDTVRIRLLDGAQEESHSFNMHRQRWLKERRNLNSSMTQQQFISLSEHFTLEFAVEGDGDFDMLYHYGTLDDLWLGNWGIMRTFKEKASHLLPLPGRSCPPQRSKQLPRRTNHKPPRVVQPSHQSETSVRRYEVVALQNDIIYNAKGDHDPFGIVFALRKDEKAILTGRINPEPLIIRANVGDWVEITLHNRLPNKRQQEHGHPHGYPAVPVEADVPPSTLISLHPQLLVYDVECSDGATVGYNLDQTVEPGKSITYRWYVDREVGVCNLWDMADLRNHRHHGAFGVLITEAKGSRYLHPETREEIQTGSQAIISHPLLGEFREFVMIIHDGVRLVDKNGNLIIDPVDPSIPVDDLTDFEDQGSRGVNYRLERLRYRLEQNPDVSKAFSSQYHGDPATPLFLTYLGDPVTVRLVCPGDRPRSHSFMIHGHSWLRYKDDLYSTHEAVSGQNIVGSHANLQLKNGAGGLLHTPGDYLYRSGNIRWDIELGMWGIIRVLNESGKIAPLTNNKGGAAWIKSTKDLPNALKNFLNLLETIFSTPRSDAQ